VNAFGNHRAGLISNGAGHHRRIRRIQIRDGEAGEKLIAGRGECCRIEGNLELFTGRCSLLRGTAPER